MEVEMENRTSSFINAVQDLEARFGLGEEEAEEIIQNYFYSDEHGRTVFDALVLKATDYTNSKAGSTDGSYIVCYLRPLFYHDKLLPLPCSVKDKYAQTCIVSLHPVGKSESMAQDSRAFTLKVGDQVVCYYEQGPADNGKQRILNFYLDRKSAKTIGNYDFTCLGGDSRKKVALNYNNNIVEVEVDPNKPCLRWKDGLRRSKALYTAGVPKKWFNHLFDKIPNSFNSYRGGQFYGKGPDHKTKSGTVASEIAHLKKMGIKTIFRFNGKDRTGPSAATERKLAEAAGMTIYTWQLNKDTYPSKQRWEVLRNALAEGNVYIHCHAGVDRTGGVVARWILETESALSNRPINMSFKQEVLNYTMSYGGAWNRAYGTLGETRTSSSGKVTLKDKHPRIPRNKRTKVGHSCENKRFKEWAFDHDTGYHGNTNKLVPQPEIAKKALEPCK